MSDTMIKSFDAINPAHYDTPRGLEAKDVIEAYGMGFQLGNAFKYILRAGKKPGVPADQDYTKAFWYVTRLLEHPDLPPLVSNSYYSVWATSGDAPGALMVCDEFKIPTDLSVAVCCVLYEIENKFMVSHESLAILALALEDLILAK